MARKTPQSRELSGASVSELAAAANNKLSQLPEALRWLAFADYMAAAACGTLDHPAPSFADLWLETREHVKVAVFGGTKLEDGIPPERRHYYHLNDRLGRQFVRQPVPTTASGAKRGWSFITGGGPGKAMAGPHFCLQRARTDLNGGAAQCLSACMAVPSGLGDEPPHQFVDKKFCCRPQHDPNLRELMLIALADVILVYPGYLGTQTELAMSEFVNYCHGRTKLGFGRRLVIVVDIFKSEFSGGSYFNPLQVGQSHNAVTYGLTKAGISAFTQHVNVDSEDADRVIVGLIRDWLVKTRGLVLSE